jgi:hypothetical protein
MESRCPESGTGEPSARECYTYSVLCCCETLIVCHVARNVYVYVT